MLDNMGTVKTMRHGYEMVSILAEFRTENSTNTRLKQYLTS
jgi:hypothetical protein